MGPAASVLKFPSPSPLGLPAGRICLSRTLRAWTRLSSRALSLPSCVTPSQSVGGRGISTPCPSPTPPGLGLGPGLPWADEPSPGILRLTAGRILTCLFAYLCRHSHFCTLHRSSRYGFAAYRTLPYHFRGQKPEVRCRRTQDLFSFFDHFAISAYNCLLKTSYFSLNSACVTWSM